VFTPRMVPTDDLGPGEIGYITAAIKTVADCNIGDTITDDRTPAAEPLPGFKPSIPVVWCGLYRSMPTTSRNCARVWASFA
jgi:GTP-binding protein LepA